MAVPRFELAPGYGISRIIKGGWQLAGGHGAIDAAAAADDMATFVAAGITTFDCADIYTGVEEMIGMFLRRLRIQHGATAASAVQVHTKCVPDRNRLPTLTRADIHGLIDRSLRRLGVDALDLVQLHWWDYDVVGCVQAAQWLDECRALGKVRHIGLTNFNGAHLATILAAGVQIVSHQVQYSVLDRRPAQGMAQRCAAAHIALLCYGALAGGFLSERWLGVAEPREPLENRSLVKYHLIMQEFGGWDRFQALLRVLAKIARRRGATIGAVAVRWTLDQPGVGGVIVGARHAGHLAQTVGACSITLDAEDRDAIARVQSEATGPTGDVYDLERVPDGRHARIMRDNLNQRG